MGSGPRSFRRRRSASPVATPRPAPRTRRPAAPGSPTGRRRSCRSSACTRIEPAIRRAARARRRASTPGRAKRVAQQRRGALGRVALAPRVRAQPVAELALAGRAVGLLELKPAHAARRSARSTAREEARLGRRGGARTAPGRRVLGHRARRTGRWPPGPPARPSSSASASTSSSAIGAAASARSHGASLSARRAKPSHNAERAARRAARSNK